MADEPIRAREWLRWNKQHQPSPRRAWSAALAGLVGVVLAGLGISRAGYSATCPDNNVPARVMLAVAVVMGLAATALGWQPPRAVDSLHSRRPITAGLVLGVTTLGVAALGFLIAASQYCGG